MTATRPLPRPAAPPSGLPPISGHHDALDGVRAIAAFAVLVFHVAADTGHTFRGGAVAMLLTGGAIGVPVFFTLSGLLLYRPWAAEVLLGERRRVRTLGYLGRRARRILPAYWLVVGYVMLVILDAHAGDPWTWLKLLTLTYTYDPHPWWGAYLGPSGLGQMWSLTIEAAWYALLPPAAAVLARHARHGTATTTVDPRGAGGAGGAETDRRARRLLVGIAVYGAVSFAFTAAAFVPHDNVQLTILAPRYFAWFAAGMALSVVSVWAHAGSHRAIRFCRTVAASWGTCWAIAGVLFCIAASPLTGPSDLATLDTVWTSELRILLYGLTAAFFVAPVALSPAGPHPMHAVLGNRVMRFLGRISYGVFLWQVAVSVTWFDLTGHVDFTGSFLAEFPAIAALTVAVATVTYYAVENPLLRTPVPRRSPATARRAGTP